MDMGIIVFFLDVMEPNTKTKPNSEECHAIIMSNTRFSLFSLEVYYQAFVYSFSLHQN